MTMRCVVTKIRKFKLQTIQVMNLNFCHVVIVGRTALGRPRSELQQAEILFSCYSLPQNLSM